MERVVAIQRWRWRLFYLACIALLVAATISCPRRAPGTLSEAIEVNGAARTYLLHIPPATTVKTKLPLVIALHPFTGTGESMERLTGFDAIADSEGFAVAYPDGRQRVWNSNPAAPSSIFGEPADDVAFIDQLIDRLIAERGIDADRVYVTGASAGGLMAHRIAGELTHKLAAAASVMITLPKAFPDYVTPSGPLPFLMVQGKADPFFPWEGGVVDEGPSRSNEYLSVKDTVGYWTANNGATTGPLKEDLPDSDPDDGTTVFRETYAAGNGADVVLYGVREGGHTWPGGGAFYPEFLVGKTSRDISASETIWTFFANFSRK